MSEPALRALVRQQKTLGEAIDKLEGKLKQTSRKTRTQEYYGRRYAELQAHWKEFDENNEDIGKIVSETGEKKEYVEKKYFDNIKEVKEKMVQKYKEKFEEDYPQGDWAQMIAKTTTTADLEDDVHEDDEVSEIYESDKEEQPLKSTRYGRSRLNEEIIERTYEHRSIALESMVQKLVLRHENFTSEIELEYDLEKIKEASRTYLTSYEDRAIIAKDRMELEGLAMEHESLMNVTDRAILSLKSKWLDAKRNKNAEPEAPKLQSLKIPKFNGQCNQWVPFLNLFERTVMQNPKLSNVQRMQYLMECLENEPKRLIQHLEISDDNFDGAVELLMRRYNDQRKIINTHLDAIIDHGNIADDVVGLKSIHDKTMESLYAIKGQKISDKQLGNIILSRLVEKKLSSQTRRSFEETLVEKRKMPKLETLLLFIEERFIGMESVSPSTTEVTRNEKSNNGECPLCPKQRHRIHQCQKFNGMSPFDRYQAIKKSSVCLNCLKDHGKSRCTLANNCKKCSRFHHVSLHYEVNRREENGNARGAQSHITCSSTPAYDVMLATAIVTARGKDGNFIELRALIDQGSTTSFITEDAMQRLKLSRERNSTIVTGIGTARAEKVHGSATVIIKPRYPSTFEVATNALIMEKLTSYDTNGQEESWNHLKGIVLADPTFYKSGRIDLIIGADIFATIVRDRIIRGPPDTPIAQETMLGWILSGRIIRKTKPKVAVSLVSTACINRQLEKFWTIEELKSTVETIFTNEEKRCEEFFTATHTRIEDGRYLTKLPFKSDDFILGKSRHIAIATLLQMEKKFRTNPALKEEYSKCINEYLQLGHMELARGTDESLTTLKNGEKHYNCFYMPHHAVVKASSTTTKLRVVFNASQKTSNGVSLNDTMMIGPTIQDDIINILLRWRGHRIALSADVEKMYRQILVDEKEWNYQRIVWRNSEDEPIRDYCMKRVTFGNASAPFVAIRTIRQLANDEQVKFPIAAVAAKDDFYVDDLLTGAHTIDEAREMQSQLRKMMLAGGMNLRKWASNDSTALNGISECDRELKKEISIDTDTTLKMLGVQWDPIRDEFLYKINLGREQEEYTKRMLVSEVARLFDPLGWLAPIIIAAKIRLQEAWLLGLEWDEKIPAEMKKNWRALRTSLTHINELRIPRYIGLGFDNVRYELHGFSDASMKAYAAVIYLRCQHPNGHVEAHIVASKSRVAPTKTVSLPRLELMGALLLARLTTKVQTAWKTKLTVYAWSDSTIALSWITGSVQRWETFVANRVIEIRDHIDTENWRHVGTKENPADVASRGTDAIELTALDLWWRGPKWLSETTINLSATKILETNEGLKPIHALHVVADACFDEVINRFSSFDRLKRVLALCMRFARNCRSERTTGPILVPELRSASAAIVKWAQSMDFANEIHNLKNGTPIRENNKLASLDPFIDDHGILRVGGRIQSENLKYNRRHPMIMEYSNVLNTLIIRDAHLKTLHGGNTLTLAFIRQSYWILKAKRAVKCVLRRCVKCAKLRAEMQQQKMGNLPAVRTTEARPFLFAGVDFCGPFDVKIANGRAVRSSKGYVAVFICLSTKALHLEAVSDMTSQAFIAALRRITSRRGHIEKLFSDNGSNFVGANRLIRNEYKTFIKEYQDEVTREMTAMEMEWQFIPPSSPHFGGIWEAGVKSVKYHLKRTIGDAKLTYEELTTTLHQIEAGLNSRPLCALTEDPNELVLTPAHFLIGEPLLMAPERSYAHTATNRLNRWQHCQKIQQDFWRRWKDEYLSRLQQRSKWLTAKRNLQIDDIVLVKDERTAVSTWPLGRIVEVHPGRDGLIRVVDVRIGNKIYRRPAVKICLLPVNEDETPQPPGRDDEHESTSKKKSIRTGIAHVSLINILLGLLLIAGVLGQNIGSFAIQKLKSEPSIYFERVGNSSLMRGQWSMIVYYDLQQYLNEFERIEDGILHLSQRCQQMQIECDPMINQFNRRIANIKERNELLKADHHVNRQRRAIMAAVIGGMALGGLAYHWLTKEESSAYAGAINNLKLNQDHIMELIKNQTTLLDLTEEAMRGNLDAMSKEHIAIRQQLFELSTADKRQELIWKIHGAALQYLLMLDSYADMQGRIIDAMTNVNSGHLHPALIPMEKMRTQVELIGKHISDEWAIPGDGNLNHIFRVARVQTGIADEKLIFRITIPILSKRPYTIWRVVPVPVSRGNHFMRIRTKNEYLLMDKSNETHYDLSKDELQSCMVNGGEVTCELHHPIYRTNSTNNSCEISIFKGHKNLSNCEIEEIKAEETWIQLDNERTWLFAMDKLRYYTMYCEDYNTSFGLTGTGLLTFDGNCTMKGEGLEISFNRYTTRSSVGYVAEIDNYNWNTENIIMEESTLRVNTSILREGIQEMQRESNRGLLSVSPHDWHHYTMIYGLIGFGILAYCVRLCSREKSSAGENVRCT